jgi:transposase
MPQKGRLPIDEKIQIVEDYLAGRIGFRSTCKAKGIGQTTLKLWIRLYKVRGVEGLRPTSTERKYSVEVKAAVVKEYLAGGISLEGLCQKYDITHSQIVRKWLKKYNCCERFRTPNSGSEIYVAKGRTTALDERIEIVSYCIENGKDYGKAIEKYQVSYQQIYGWVRKYEESGVSGLADRRGKRKLFEEMSEVERLRAELKVLKAENKRKDMEIAVLKKVQEIERRRG